MSNTNRNTVREIITNQKGRFFAATFIGKDGKEHTFNGRTGVKKYSKGGVNYAAGKDDLISVYNVQKKGYRNVFLDGVTKLVADHVTYTF